MSSVNRSVASTSRGVVYGASSTSHLSYEGSSNLSASVRARASKDLKDTTTFIQVQRKVRKHKKYENLSGADLVKKVTDLMDEETILCTFSHLVEQKLLEKVDKLNDNPDEFAAEHTEELHQEKASQKSRYIDVANIPLKLYVRDLEITGLSGLSALLICPIGNFLCTDYGAKHVALTVGDVLLEWDESSLVIPKIGTPEGDIQDITKYCPHNVAADRKAPHEDASLCNAAGENELWFQRTADKKPIFEELAKVILKYNTRYYYNSVARNCQKFVCDALKALGFEKKPPSPKVGARMQELKSKKNSTIPSSFFVHEDLDFFIQKQPPKWFDQLDADSFEYLQHCYMNFHGDIACHVPGCQAPILDDALKQRLKVA